MTAILWNGTLKTVGELFRSGRSICRTGNEPLRPEVNAGRQNSSVANREPMHNLTATREVNLKSSRRNAAVDDIRSAAFRPQRHIGHSAKRSRERN